MWRAIRYGLDGELLDLERAASRTRPRETLERLLSWSAPACAELGIDVALPERNGAQRQRAMIDAGVGHARDLRRDRRRDQATHMPGSWSTAEVTR